MFFGVMKEQILLTSTVVHPIGDTNDLLVHNMRLGETIG
jgi:hypothetical protein